MAHTYYGPQGTRFHNNSDLSGDVIATVRPYDSRDGTQITVRIPGEDIKSLVAQYVRLEKITRLEDMDDDEVLGL